jgi:hypothetical protein
MKNNCITYAIYCHGDRNTPFLLKTHDLRLIMIYISDSATAQSNTTKTHHSGRSLIYIFHLWSYFPVNDP